jgi:predicted DNA-binding protein YlxM (UPF0122 family)
MTQALAVDTSNNLPNSRNKIDIIEAFKLKFQHHLTYAEIAERFGVKAPSVHASLKRFMHILHNPEESATYEQNRTQILTAVEFRLVNQLANKKKIKAASLNNIAYAVSQVNNMIRLEKGQATSITEHIDGDLSNLVDQLCGMKSAGSGSTIDVTPAAAAPVDILASLEAPDTAIPSQAPTADRSTCANSEGTSSPVQPAKSAKRTKRTNQTVSKSIVKDSIQASCNITSTLNSKVNATKEASEPVTNSDNQSSQEKEWYE